MKIIRYKHEMLVYKFVDRQAFSVKDVFHLKMKWLA